jgi:hypothetical protein
MESNKRLREDAVGDGLQLRLVQIVHTQIWTRASSYLVVSAGTIVKDKAAGT